MNVNLFTAKDYENKTTLRPKKTNPNKANLERMNINFLLKGIMRVNQHSQRIIQNSSSLLPGVLRRESAFRRVQILGDTQPRCFSFLVLSNFWLTLYIVYCLIPPYRPWRLSLVLKWVFFKAGFLVLVRRFLTQICITFGFRNS